MSETLFDGGKLVLDPIAVNNLLHGADGPVVRELFVVGELVRQEAKRLVGVSTPPPSGVFPSRKRDSSGKFLKKSTSSSTRKPGALRDSIVKRLVDSPSGPVMQIGSDDPVALWHHEGTQPHIIRAKNAPKLVFYWARVGKVVAFVQVHHPGTKPNRFLVNALAVLRRRY